MRLTLELRVTTVQNRQHRNAHVRLCKRVNDANDASAWERQFDLDMKPVELANNVPAPPPAPLPAAGITIADRASVENELQQAGGGAQRAGRSMLAAAAGLLQAPDPEIARMLGHAVERPNKVAIVGAPGTGKSYSMSHIVDSLMPPDLVNLDNGAQLVVTEAHARSARDADMDAAPDVLIYCPDIALPDLSPVPDGEVNHPNFNPFEEHLLFPHGEGGSRSAVPINAIPTSFDDEEPCFIIRVRLVSPTDAIQAVREGIACRKEEIEEERKLDEEARPLELQDDLQDDGGEGAAPGELDAEKIASKKVNM